MSFFQFHVIKFKKKLLKIHDFEINVDFSKLEIDTFERNIHLASVQRRDSSEFGLKNSAAPVKQ